MTTEMTITRDADDGWSDFANDYSETLTRGDLLKCSKGHWLLGQERLPEGTKLVATGAAAAWIKWGLDENGKQKPVDEKIRKKGQPMPDRVDLDDPEAQIPGLDGKPRYAWQNTRYIYFVDPETAATCTFSTATWEGRRAAIALGDQITTMRTARPGVSPIVELHSAPYQNKFGMQMKPVLKVVGWVGGRTADPKQLKALPKNADMDDACPF